MIAEVIPGAYDISGKKVFRPFERRKGIRPTFPLGRYVSQPLSVHCQSIEDVRRFLCNCKYVSDKELFGKDDYWQPPEEFEQKKKGDCDDFAFWTWRQFMELGFVARVVFGHVGRYGAGHAWVHFMRDGRCYIVEPTRASFGSTFPRLTTVSYEPGYSVAWDGENLTYFAHQAKGTRPSFFFLLGLLPEYLSFWIFFWVRMIPKMHKVVWHLSKRLLKNFRWNWGRGSQK